MYVPNRYLAKRWWLVESSPLRDNFGQVAATRAVVKAAIAHNRETANWALETETPDLVKHDFPSSSEIGMLPWAERAVYFLRRVLHYSRRDTALLLGISDANVDQLYKFAEKRIGNSSGIPSPSLTDVFEYLSRGRG